MAFEPDQPTFNLLVKVIAQNALKNVSANCVALSNKSGTAVLFKKKDTLGDLNMSIVPGAPSDWEQTEVSIVPMSQFIHSDIHFAKIDTEGAEVAIIENLVQTKRLTNIKELVIEFHPARSTISVEIFCLILVENDFELITPAHNNQTHKDYVLRFRRIVPGV
jgi:FkbM family methyltransferase